MENSRLNHPSSHKGGIFISSPSVNLPIPSPSISAHCCWRSLHKGNFASSFVHSFSSTPAYKTKGRRAASLSSACSRGFASSLNFYTPGSRRSTHSYSLNLFLLGDLLCTSSCAVTKTFPRLCVPQVISVSFGFQTRSRQRG